MDNNKLDAFLKNKMSLNEMEIATPDAELITLARTKIALRKKRKEESKDFFMVISGIFNLQIKLYQAGLATLIIAGYIYYFTKSDNQTTQTVVTQYVTEHSSVNSSTVLATILTFIAKN